MKVLSGVRKAEVDKSGTVWGDKVEAAKYNHATNKWRRSSGWSLIENDKPWDDFLGEVVNA